MMKRLNWRNISIAVWAVVPVVLVGIIQNIPHDIVRTDFANLWFAGRSPVNLVYDTAWMTKFAQQTYPQVFYVNFVYPPPALFVARLIGTLPIVPATIVWDAGSAALFCIAAQPHMQRLPSILAILTPAALINLVFGQWGLVIGALWLWSFRYHPWAAALLILKPHIGFLAAVPMAKNRRLFAAATLIGLVLIIASIVAFGVEPWVAFFGKTLGQARLIKDQTFLVWILMGVTPLIGYPWWAWACFALAASVLVTRDFNVFSAATATFLISPYGFHYDLTVVSLGFGIMAATEELTPPQRVVAALGFFSPALVRLGTWLVPPILLAGLWLQTRHRAPE